MTDGCWSGTLDYMDHHVVLLTGAAHAGVPADHAVVAAYEDGPYAGFAVLDRLKAEMPHRVGLGEPLTPVPHTVPSQPR